MDIQNIKEFHCDICYELYDENRKCPRLLACGHSFCHSCISKLLTQSPSCPNCKQLIQFPNIDCIPIIYSIKSIVSRLHPTSQVSLIEQNSEANPELEKDSLNSLTLTNTSKSKELPYEGYCEDHNSYKHLRCMDCKYWVCGVCVALNHKPCQTLLVAEALEEMKQEVSREVEVEIEAQKSQNKYLDVVLKDLEGKKSSLKKEIKKLQLELRNRVNDLKSLDKSIEKLQFIKSERKNNCEKLKRLESSVKEATNDDQFMKAMNTFNDLLSRVQKLVEELTIPQRSHLTLEILREWCQEVSVYASRCNCGVNQYGQVVVKGDSVWVHSFKPQRPNRKDAVISFRDLLIAFNGSLEFPRRGFIQVEKVEEGTSILGDVVIVTDSLTPRALNFLLLCSGIKGRSYKGIKLDYGYQTSISTSFSSGGGAVVKGIKDMGIYKTPITKGFVGGWWVKETDSLSYFHIRMEDYTDRHLIGKFALVEEGLDFCEGIYKDKTDVLIKHCGLVI